MLAKNIAHQAILAGHSALFTTAADLLLDLNRQKTARALERRFRHYTRPGLLVIDKVGYLAYDARAADLLFQLVSRRYEHRSLLLTTNLLEDHAPYRFRHAPLVAPRHVARIAESPQRIGLSNTRLALDQSHEPRGRFSRLAISLRHAPPIPYSAERSVRLACRT